MHSDPVAPYSIELFNDNILKTVHFQLNSGTEKPYKAVILLQGASKNVNKLRKA